MDLVRRSPRPEKQRLEDAIKRFQATLSPGDASKFAALQSESSPKASDVFRLTEEVNRDGHKVHRTWRQYGGRLQRALDQILVFTKVGDILVGGSQNMIACGVWAAVRLSIQIATGYLGFFDKVSNLWMRIGRSSEVQEELVQLFPQCTDLQSLMSEYLVATINFCQRIVAFAKRPLISQITSTFSITFDKEFSEFEHQLSHLAKLMNQKIGVLTTQMALDSSRTMAKTSKLLSMGSLAARKREYQNRRAKLLKRLCPFQDRLDRRQRHERKKGPVDWILGDAQYIQWLNSALSSKCILSGTIGSGKTVMAANIVSSLQSACSSDSCVAGFFCRASDPGTLKFDTIMGSIAYQFVRSLGREAADAVNKYLPSQNTPGGVIDMTLKALPRLYHYYVVIDGLDECSMETATEVLDGLARFWEGRFAHYLFSCRADSPIIPAIQRSKPVSEMDSHVSLSNPKHDDEIKHYIDSEIEARRHVRKLTPELEAAVRMALIAGAQGMFLWATLQLDMIYPQDHTRRTLTDSDLIHLLERLPKDLTTTFDKALENISDKQRAKKVFEIVAAAERPLTTDELAVATNIQPGNINWDQATFPLSPSALVWTCGGGLLEVVEEEDSVHYIHHSALRHLLLDGMEPPGPDPSPNPTTSLYKFSLEQANTIVAAVCVTYLSYTMHDSRLVKRVKMPDDRNITEAVAHSVARNQALVSDSTLAQRLISRVLDRRKPPSAQSSVAIFNMVNDLARQQHEDDDDRAARVFLDYASRYWLDHTKHFINTPDSALVPDVVYELFASLARSDLPHIRCPWLDDSNASRMRWALRTSHLAICRLVLRAAFGLGAYPKVADIELEDAKPVIHEIQQAITTSPDSVMIPGKEFVGVIALSIYFQLYERRYTLQPLSTHISNLTKFGLDPNTPLGALDGGAWPPLCLLLRRTVLFSEEAEVAEGLEVPINALLSNGASPVGLSGYTYGGPCPVFMALELGLQDIALKMLSRVTPIDVNFEDPKGRTLLGMAILYSDKLLDEAQVQCRRLLQMGAKPNKPTSIIRLSRASYVSISAAQTLAEYKKSDEQSIAEPVKVPPLILAARNAHCPIFQELIYAGASLDLLFRGKPIRKAVDRIVRRFEHETTATQESTDNSHLKCRFVNYWKAEVSEREQREVWLAAREAEGV